LGASACVDVADARTAEGSTPRRADALRAVVHAARGKAARLVVRSHASVATSKADRNDPVYDRWLCWEQGDEVFFSVNDGRVPGKVGRLPRDEFDRLFERREFCGNTCPSGWQKRRSVAS
jgi:hypothetical protein